jgi:hypothetical protein
MDQIVNTALHIPEMLRDFCRRHGRMVTGEQSSGDALVAATLERLIDNPNLLVTTEEPRVNLYRLLTRVINLGAVKRVNSVVSTGFFAHIG